MRHAPAPVTPSRRRTSARLTSWRWASPATAVGITVLTGAGGLRPSYPEPRESYRVTTSTAAVASAHAQRW